MSRLFKKAEEPIQPIEKELMLGEEKVEKWGPSQEGQADYKPSLNEIEKGLLEEGAQNPVKKVGQIEHAADNERWQRLKEEGRLGLQPDKKFLHAVQKEGVDPKVEYEKSGQVHMPVEGVTYTVGHKQRHQPPL